MKRYAIAIHGGAGTLSKENMTAAQRSEHEAELLKALETGRAILEAGGSSLDATQAAVVALEDCALFNAGRGSVFNREGGHEMDAAIMDGGSLKAGAVAGIAGVKNPILLARAVLDRGEYVMISGEKAAALAKEENIPLEDSSYFFTDMRYQQWQEVQRERTLSPAQRAGTVGAVALDQEGHLAAATSTGGLVNKAYGRIGDSCSIGAGTYAHDATCAISCTGDGEAFIRAVAAYDIACIVQYRQLPLAAASEEVLKKVLRLGGTGGLAGISRSGTIVMPFTSEGMYRACCHLNGRTEVGIF